MNAPEPPYDQATQEALERLSLGMRAIAARILENEERAKEEGRAPPGTKRDRTFAKARSTPPPSTTTLSGQGEEMSMSDPMVAQGSDA